ncbi:MAG TPA: UDP-N-acetylglucosamine 2-epimerase (hydrolyzing) [Pseudomonadales bacterium]|nr:UDP-N-acetylglucosamine 2-epimerase (hydrolyzing) [Pseudomonadales bacterium]
MSKSKICVVTGSRAEYGLLYWLLKKLESAEDFELELVVTGMHLSPEFGMTYKEIEKDGFPIAEKIPMLLSSDAPAGVTKSTGLGLIGFADLFDRSRPDVVVVLGDRFELFAVASAALFAAIPIVHIHGGEVTTGAFDEAIRHSITKMASLHFTAAEAYRKRVIQLGEQPDTVFNVGAPGLENIQKISLLTKEETEQSLGLKLGQKSLLVTWHPVTLEPGRAKQDLKVLLDALDKLDDTKFVFTKSNADNEGRSLNRLIVDYVTSCPEKAVVHTSLGQLRYLSTLKQVTGVIGNSSSGIIEAPSIKTGTINIGRRQEGRVRASSIIDCDPDLESICSAFERLFSSEFQSLVQHTRNPHDGGPVSENILRILRQQESSGWRKKPFFDVTPNDLLF